MIGFIKWVRSNGLDWLFDLLLVANLLFMAVVIACLVLATKGALLLVIPVALVALWADYKIQGPRE